MHVCFLLSLFKATSSKTVPKNDNSTKHPWLHFNTEPSPYQTHRCLVILVLLSVCLSLPILCCVLTVWFCSSCFCCRLKGEAPILRPSPPTAVSSGCQTSSNTRRETGWMGSHTRCTLSPCNWAICSSFVEMFRDKNEISVSNISSPTACRRRTDVKLAEDSSWQPSFRKHIKMILTPKCIHSLELTA